MDMELHALISIVLDIIEIRRDDYNILIFDLRLFSQPSSQKTIELIRQRFLLREQNYTEIILLYKQTTNIITLIYHSR